MFHKSRFNIVQCLSRKRVTKGDGLTFGNVLDNSTNFTLDLANALRRPISKNQPKPKPATASAQVVELNDVPRKEALALEEETPSILRVPARGKIRNFYTYSVVGAPAEEASRINSSNSDGFFLSPAQLPT